MAINIYLDEDAQDGDLVSALIFRGIDVLTSGEAGMNGRDDGSQLDFAAGQNRVIFSFNVRDFAALHAAYLGAEKGHCGIILARQQQFSIGETSRRLLRLAGTLSSEEMQNRLEFLTSWAEVT